jgi:hypothetical protein
LKVLGVLGRLDFNPPTPVFNRVISRFTEINIWISTGGGFDYIIERQ